MTYLLHLKELRIWNLKLIMIIIKAQLKYKLSFCWFSNVKHILFCICYFCVSNCKCVVYLFYIHENTSINKNHKPYNIWFFLYFKQLTYYFELHVYSYSDSLTLYRNLDLERVQGNFPLWFFNVYFIHVHCIFEALSAKWFHLCLTSHYNIIVWLHSQQPVPRHHPTLLVNRRLCVLIASLEPHP